MEIERGTLTQIVAAARMSMKLAEAIEMLLVDKNAMSIADEISATLQDALFEISKETLDAKKNFATDSMTMRLLNGDMSNGAVADFFFMMDKIRRNHLAPQEEEVKQPAPQTMSKEEFRRMYVQNGGYSHSTPEGEFT